MLLRQRGNDRRIRTTSMNPQPRYHQMLVSPHVGGGAKLAMQIHKYAVANRGPVSRLLLPGGGEAERAAVDHGFPFTDYELGRLTSMNRLRAGLENLRLVRKTAAHGPGVVHVHAPFVYGAARPFFLMSRLKTVLHIHLDFTADQLRWALKSPPDVILICAEFMRGAVEEALTPAGRKQPVIRVLRNAVDTELFFPSERTAAKAALGLRLDRPLLMMAANLSPHKGQETAIRAVASLKALGHEVDLWVVGQERSESAGYLKQLRSLTATLGVDDSVTFAGFRNDVPALLRAADFVLLPSTSEGLPLVILEAQASKAIALAAPTAGIPEVIADGRTGFLIAASDHLAYARRIASLLDDPAQAHAIAETAYRHVREHHDIGRYCGRVLSEYDELLQP